jgi:tetratricopeptide (TPR) repeat protein
MSESGGVRWIIREGDGRITGPYTTDQVLRKIDRGALLGAEQVAVYPGGKWITLSNAPEFYDRLLDALSNEAAQPQRPAAKPPREASATTQKRTSDRATRTGPTAPTGTDHDESEESQALQNDPSAHDVDLSLIEPTLNPEDDPDMQTHSSVTSPSIIELTDLQNIREKEWFKKVSRPAALGLFVFILTVGVVMWTLLEDPIPVERIRLLAPGQREASLSGEAARVRFKAALDAFHTDSYAGYQKAQNGFVELAESAWKRPEDGRERASVMQLLCLTYRELWPYAFQDATDKQTVLAVVQEAKRLDPGGINGAVCEIVSLMIEGRWQEAASRSENALAEEGKAPILFELRGELFFLARDHTNASAYFSQSRVLYADWIKTTVQDGRAKAGLDQVNEAIALFRSALDKNPNHPVARMEWGILEFTKANQLDRAYELLLAAIESGERMPRPLQARAHFFLAQVLSRRGQQGRARDTAARALRLAPGNAEIKDLLETLGGSSAARTRREDSQELVYTGDQLAKQGDCFAAQAQYKTAFEADSGNGVAAMKAGRCLWQLNQINDSIQWIERAIRAEPKLISAYVELADYHAQRYNFQAATNVMKRALQVAPRSYEVWRGFALVELRRNNFKGAIGYSERALRIYKTDIDSLVVMGKAYIGLRDYVAAHDRIMQVLEQDFNHTEAQSLYGRIRAAMQGTDLGAEYLNQLISRYVIKRGQPAPPPAVEYRIALAEIYLADERAEQAVEVLRQAIALDSNNKRALINYGKALRARFPDDVNSALEPLLKAAILDPSDPTPVYHAGQIYLEKARYREARVQFERVIQINERYPRAYIALGQAALGAGDSEFALRQAQIERSNNPDLADAFLLAAEAYYAMGQYGNCGAEYQKAVSKGIQNASVLIRAARCMRLAGALDSAVSLLRQAITIESGLAEIYIEQGLVYQSTGLVNETVVAYETFLKLDPSSERRSQVEACLGKIQAGDMSSCDFAQDRKRR